MKHILLLGKSEAGFRHGLRAATEEVEQLCARPRSFRSDATTATSEILQEARGCRATQLDVAERLPLDGEGRWWLGPATPEISPLEALNLETLLTLQTKV